MRRRLLEGQNLQYSDESSLGTDKLEPVAHWPEENYPPASSSPDANIPVEPNKPTKINLVDALRVAARNSFDYQSRKESVFRAALDLDLTRNDFRNIFGAQADSQLNSDTTGDRTVSTVDTGAGADVTRRLKNGLDLTGAWLST